MKLGSDIRAYRIVDSSTGDLSAASRNTAQAGVHVKRIEVKGHIRGQLGPADDQRIVQGQQFAETY